MARRGFLHAAARCSALFHLLGVFLPSTNKHPEGLPCVKYYVMNVALSRKGSQERRVVSNLGNLPHSPLHLEITSKNVNPHTLVYFISYDDMW